MRAVFINLSHPDTPHVSAVRVPNFARALAERGHQIVLLTRTLDDQDPGSGPAELAGSLSKHDWSTPLLLPIRPACDPRLARMRSDRLPTPLRKAVTAWFLLRHGGVYADWSLAARSIEGALAKEFRPQSIWATFLPSDSLVIAKRLATAAGCPWHLDLKDSWSHRLPAGVRRLTANRFRGADSLTSNSHFHGQEARRWFNKRATTIYDGISDVFLDPKARQAGWPFRIVLVGGTYGRDRLLPFLRGLHSWLIDLSPDQRRRVVFEYAGSDAPTVEAALRETGAYGGLCRTVVHGYLPLDALAALCISASVNSYLWLPSTFHHKVLELLACGRPVVAFTGEHAEARVSPRNSARLFTFGRCTELRRGWATS